MKWLDRVIQRWRMRQAARFIPDRVRLIDVGAYEGELFRMLGTRLTEGFGVEPLARRERTGERYAILPGFFPQVRPDSAKWDVITLLAVLEHISPPAQPGLASACHELLRPGGRVIVTVPAKAVDHILAVLRFLRLIDGMSLEEHYGFEPIRTLEVFTAPGFRLLHHSQFQMGLNHLFVFERV